MKLGIITACYRRTRIFEIFGAGIERLRRETSLDIPVVAVGDIENKQVCDKYNIQFIEYPNKPLTGKFNRACGELRGKADCIAVMGSDNLISTNSFLRLHNRLDSGYDMVGFDDVYFFGMDDENTGKLLHFPTTKVLGVGRAINKRILDLVDWTPYDQDRDRAIDVVMIDNVRRFNPNTFLLSGGYVFDLKSRFNLNRMHLWAKKLPPISDSILWNNIGEEETRLIKEYLNSKH